CSGSRIGCTRDITDFGATRYRFLAAVAGIVDPDPPRISIFHFFGAYFQMIRTTSILSCCLLLGATLSASEPQTGIEGVITVGPVSGGPARIGIPGFETISKRDVPRAKRKRNSNTVYHRRSGIFPCPTGTGSPHRFAKGQKRRNRALWALRSRCSCRPDDEGRVALRHLYPVGAFY